MDARATVVAHLEVLFANVSALRGAGAPQQEALARQLQAAALRWSAAAESPGSGISGTLAAESCEVVVGTLRLLREELALSPSEAAAPYTSAFLVLGRTVRVFEEVPGSVPANGQFASVHSLTSAAGQQLNGQRVTVVRFHAPSGRFIVRVRLEDPPAEWKKLKMENLALEGEGSVDTAREHGIACLEAVAGIFDELLQEMLIEASELDEDSLQRVMQAELATAMWEALACCAGGGRLRLSGAAFRELCGGAPLCSLLARYVLSAHFSAHVGITGFLASDCADVGMLRIRALQEGLAQAYCDLYQPAALWGAGAERNDSPIAKLQADLNAHLQSVSQAAVSFGVLPSFMDAVDFHLSWAATAEPPAPVPLVLPVLLSRFVCAMVMPGASAPQLPAVRRHVRLRAWGLLEILQTFVTLVCEQLGRGAGSPADLLVSLHAVLDLLVVLADDGLWGLAGGVTDLADSIVTSTLDCAQAAADPKVLARLALAFLQRPSNAVSLRLFGSCLALAPGPQVTFSRTARVQAKNLCRLEVAAVQRAIHELLGGGGGADLGGEVSEGWEREMQKEMSEVDALIDKCLRELPDSIRDQQPAPRAPESSLEVKSSFPVLPGQQTRDGAAIAVDGTPAGRRAKKKLARSDLGQIRGVDPSTAPAELRCAIDGKVVGNPIRSPDGHLFERETFENWIHMCGSVCPISGNPLRLEDCSEDRAAQKQVVEWAKAAKAEHKRQVRERREMRQAAAPGDAPDSILL